MPKIWQIDPQKQKIVRGVDDLVEQLLINRGLKTKKEKDQFFNSKLTNFEKDLKISGIAFAKKRILRAIKKGELMIIYGDYDVDGLCGTAILYHSLTFLGAKVLPYIPHREKEGYGLSKEGLKSCLEQGANLVITVDNGIVACEEAKFAKKLGLDLIITDHHLPLKEKPQVQALVCSTKMSGAAVAWCLIRQMVPKEKAEEFLDLVALSTVCDLMALTGVNRALVKQGLEVLNKTQRVGLLALMRDSRIELGNLTTYHLGYILGPRLNAKGRLEHALDALRLLCTKDTQKAQKLARLLSETNDQKKKLVVDAISQAKMIIEKDKALLSQKKILVLHSQDWIPGIVGLVAGRMSEEYNLPTIAIAVGENESKGSARSVKGVNIIQIIRECSELLLDVGGHPQAAGFTLETSKIEVFRNKLETVMEEVKINQNSSLEVEAVIEAGKISPRWIDQLAKFEPFGIGNPRPALVSFDMKLSNLRTVGDEQHLKGQAEEINFIAFGFGAMINVLGSWDQRADLVYYLEFDEYNGHKNLQLRVLDIKLPEDGKS